MSFDFRSDKNIIWTIRGLLVFSVFGVIDATYLTVMHFLAKPVVCLVGSSCDLVTQSPYATLGPVPIALLGLIYYLAVFFLLIAHLDARDLFWLYLGLFLTGLGWLISLALIYIQAFILEAFCTYCLISAFITTVLFFGLLWHYRQIKISS